MSALIGGLFGAALMAVALPLVRPDHPVHRLARTARDRGVRHLDGGVAVGQCAAARRRRRLLRHDAGDDRLRPATGTLRWTMDSLYLWEGLPLVPVTLGIFALPELCDLAIGRTAVVAGGKTIDTKTGMWLGIKDCFDALVPDPALLVDRRRAGRDPRHRRRRSSTGSPMATRCAPRRGAQQTFGKGDVRGVIAAESATNAREGGAPGADGRVRRAEQRRHGDPARRVPDPRPGARARTC